MPQNLTIAAPGVAVVRNEDEPLLRGVARYLPDLEGEHLHAVFVRSNMANAELGVIDSKGALEAEGVVAVLTAADLPLERIRAHASGVPAPLFNRPPLATGRVRFVGDPVAIVVATSRTAAVDAAELVEVQYDPLPAVLNPEEALSDGAFVLFPDNGSNQCSEAHMAGEGDVLEDAEVVVEGRFVNQRVSATPMETNGAMAVPDTGNGAVTVWASTQRVHALRDELAHVLGLDT